MIIVDAIIILILPYQKGGRAMSNTSFEESVRADLHELYSSEVSSEQLSAANSRDYNKARSLGLSLNQYLYYVSHRYASKLCRLLH